MLDIRKINKESEFTKTNRTEFTSFLYHHLGEYGDPFNEINQCLDYAFSDEASAGGFALAAFLSNNLVGGVIINKTGMGGYIPDWILVYIAVDEKYRGIGIGKSIIHEVFKLCNGDIKLHVEYHNPAKSLYERLGFENKYAEMRYKRK